MARTHSSNDASSPLNSFLKPDGSNEQASSHNPMAIAFDAVPRYSEFFSSNPTATTPAQNRIFSEAEAICGIVGSGLTNAVFCQPGCKLTLIAQDFMPDSWLEWISQCVEADFKHLVCPTGYQQMIEPDVEALAAILNKS